MTDNFINTKILKRLKIGRLQLHTPKTIWNIDETHNKAGTITECVDLQVQVGDWKEQMRFLITDLGEDEIVLGYPWLAAFQPKIDWKNVVLDESMCHGRTTLYVIRVPILVRLFLPFLIYYVVHHMDYHWDHFHFFDIFSHSRARCTITCTII